MKECKNHVIEAAVASLENSPPEGKRLRGSMMMDLYKVMAPLYESLAPFRKARDSIFEEYGQAVAIDGKMSMSVPDKIKGEDGEMIPNPRLGAFSEEYNEILNKETEISAILLPAYLLDHLDFDREGFAALFAVGVLEEEGEEDAPTEAPPEPEAEDVPTPNDEEDPAK